MGRINRKTLRIKVSLSKKLNHYIGWGLEKAIQEAEKRGKTLDGTAIELALMNRAGHNLETLAAAMGKAQEKRIRADAKKIEAELRKQVRAKHPDVHDMSVAVACIALAKKAIVRLDKQITSR
jgi:hypothetical protein